MRWFLGICLVVVLSGTLHALTFEEFTKKAYKKSDLFRDNEVRRGYDYWEEMRRLSAIVPLVDATLQPQYVSDRSSFSLLGTTSEYYDYRGAVALSQSLPSNTDISAAYQYDYFDNNDSANSQRNMLTLSVEQTFWGINTPYHQYKMWRNARAGRMYKTKEYDLNILQQCYTVYITLCLAEKEYQLSKNQYERYRDIYEGARNKYALGLMTIVDYSRIKKRFKFAELDVSSAEKERSAAYRNAEQFLNETIDGIDFLIPRIDKALIGSEPSEKKAYLSRDVDDAYRMHRIALQQNTLKLSGFLNINYDDTGAYGQDGFEYSKYELGVKLSIPLTNLMKYSSVKMEKLNYILKKNEYDDKMESVEREFQELLKDIDYYHDKLRVYEDVLPTMRENYRASANFFAMGALTLQEMITIEDEYIALEREYLSTLLTYSTQAIDASRYTGTAFTITEGYHD